MQLSGERAIILPREGKIDNCKSERSPHAGLPADDVERRRSAVDHGCLDIPRLQRRGQISAPALIIMNDDRPHPFESARRGRLWFHCCRTLEADGEVKPAPLSRTTFDP